MKVKKIHDSCSGAVNRLHTVLHSTEQQLESNKRQANYLAQVAAAKSLVMLKLLAGYMISSDASQETFIQRRQQFAGYISANKIQNYLLADY